MRLIFFTLILSFTNLLADEAFETCLKSLQASKVITKEIPFRYAKKVRVFEGPQHIFVATSRNGSEWSQLVIGPTYPLKSCPLAVWLPERPLRLATFSTTVVSFLDELGESSKVKAVLLKKHLSTLALQKLKNPLELGYPANPELLARSKIDLVFTFHVLSSELEGESRLLVMQMKTLPINEFLETDPLGRAEWIKLFGALLNKGKEADQIFRQIEHRYLELQKNLVGLQSKKVALASFALSSTVLPSPQGPLFKILQDSKADLIWKNEGRLLNGELTLNTEEVLKGAERAELLVSLIPEENQRTFFTHNPRLQGIIKTQKIYALSKDKTGATEFFESGFTHPEKILESLLALFYNDPHHQFKNYWFKELAP